MEEQKLKNGCSCNGRLVANIFLVLLILAGFTYIVWQNKQTKAQLNQLQHKFQEQNIAIDQYLKSQGSEIFRTLFEIQHLVRLANTDLMVSHNIPLAIQALTMADQRLIALNNANLIAVRKALAKDIETLKMSADVDSIGIILKLNALGDQILKLPVPNLPTKLSKPAKSEDQQYQETSKLPQTFWQKFNVASWTQLQNIIIIRRHEQPMQSILSTEQQIDLIQKIQLALNRAEWAVLYKQVPIYQAALQKVITLADLYFVSNPAVASNITKTVQELSHIDLTPKDYNLNASLQAIHEAMSQMPAEQVRS